jgi:FkbM family methyltransferase
MTQIQTSSIDSAIFRLLVDTARNRRQPWIRLWWNTLYQWAMKRRKVVHATIHGHEAVMNFGYSYPITARLHAHFNDPLLQLVQTVWKQKGRPLRFVDVGAAIGDTVLLIQSNCADMVSEYVCIDGDEEFFHYLEQNLAELPIAKPILHQLSRSGGLDPALTRLHAGVTDQQDGKKVATAPLHQVLSENNVGPIDILKVDVDGFDGEVLAGSEKILQEWKPAVIFELHPGLCKQMGNDWRASFSVLKEHGYSRCAWFTKFGEFSHFGQLADMESAEAACNYCLSTKTHLDWHYDVIALPDGIDWDWVELADLQFAKNCKNRY